MLSEEVHDEMLDINEPHLFDESISAMNFYEYTVIHPKYKLITIHLVTKLVL